jgi:hypothetical protein
MSPARLVVDTTAARSRQASWLARTPAGHGLRHPHGRTHSGCTRKRYAGHHHFLSGSIAQKMACCRLQRCGTLSQKKMWNPSVRHHRHAHKQTTQPYVPTCGWIIWARPTLTPTKAKQLCHHPRQSETQRSELCHSSSRSLSAVEWRFYPSPSVLTSNVLRSSPTALAAGRRQSHASLLTRRRSSSGHDAPFHARALLALLPSFYSTYA